MSFLFNGNTPSGPASPALCKFPPPFVPKIVGRVKIHLLHALHIDYQMESNGLLPKIVFVLV
ncbi:hypothetical protein CW304_29645 [Bacillus sp. UFRGS-B20]|nr:hypothetical protein CW304_29645 [Bacillus sp. UFRGS-B20]